MNVTTEPSGEVDIFRVHETRMMYPMLAEFSAMVSSRIAGGSRKILIDLSPVTYVDSATIGCFMDLYRTLAGIDGHLALSNVQKRVETMLTMTGTQNFIQIHADEATALRSFEG